MKLKPTTTWCGWPVVIIGSHRTWEKVKDLLGPNNLVELYTFDRVRSAGTGYGAVRPELLDKLLTDSTVSRANFRLGVRLHPGAEHTGWDPWPLARKLMPVEGEIRKIRPPTATGKPKGQTDKPTQRGMLSVENLHVFLCFDYSQIEIRELAEISGDKLLISQFASGADIHCQVGKELTGWPVERIAKDQNTRRIVKGFHFSLVYGTGEDSMVGRMQAEGLKVTKKLIHSFFVRYFKRYKGVAKFMQDSRDMAEILGYVETMFGFRRYIHKEDEDRKTYWANQAINSRVQGSAHQLVLIALALLNIKPKTYHLLQDPIMEVHDALYWQVKVKDLPEAYRQAKELLEHGVIRYVLREFKRKLLVPLLAEAKAGFCLGSLVDYQGEPVSEFLPKWRAKHLEVKKTSWEKLRRED